MKILVYIILVASFISCNNKKDVLSSSPEVIPANESDFDYKSFIGKDFHMDDQHSYVGFKIKYFGFSPVRGRFNEFDGTMFYDPADLTSIRTTVFIDAGSINTGNERRDNDLKSEGTWFDVAKYPMIMFTSSRAVIKPDATFDLIGELTIKGITKIDTITFEIPTKMSKDWAGNDQVDFSGKISIDRQDFDVFGGDFWSTIMENGVTQLSDEVEIELDIHTRRYDYQERYDSADSSDIVKIVLDKIKDSGINPGLELIDELYAQEKLSAGKFSSIGHTLNSWKMQNEALSVFNKRLEYFPTKTTTRNQLGITHLLLGNKDESLQNFEMSLKNDSTDSRTFEYMRLVDVLSNNPSNPSQ